MGLSQNSSFGSGNYLSQKDVVDPRRVTIRDVRMETLKNDNGEEEKPVCHFVEDVKPLVLNRVNFLTIDEIAGGHDDTDRWIGKQVELYVDPGIMYGAKRVGGVRVRLPSGASSNGSPLPLAWTIEQAIEAAAKIGKSRDQLVAMLKDKGLTGWNAAKCTPIVQAWIDENELPF